MILRPLIRTYFLQLAINTLFEKLYWNLISAPEFEIPRDEKGLIKYFESGQAKERYRLYISSETIKASIKKYGLEKTLKMVDDVIWVINRSQ